MTDDQLREAVQATATGREVPCEALLKLAEQGPVEPGRVGAMCDELGVKIRACQLGCFR